MTTFCLHHSLTAAQRGAALVAVDLYKGNDFMGWSKLAAEAIRHPGYVSKADVERILIKVFCDLGGLANLAENKGNHYDGHPMSNKLTLAAEARKARDTIAKAIGITDYAV
jgi:hypothetical protein